MSVIKVSIVSSNEEIFSGEATMVFATGSLGELGIAPGHTPLLTGLAPGPVRHTLFYTKQKKLNKKAETEKKNKTKATTKI